MSDVRRAQRFPGALFVFEGHDGAGKTSLARALTEKLNALNVPAQYAAFPGNEPGTLGECVYRIHHNQPGTLVNSLSPASLQLLHIASHIDNIETRILPALKRGITVVLDRFWWSTWVYGVITGVNRKLLRSIINTEEICWGNALPSAVFLVERRTKEDPPPRHVQHLQEEYRQLAERENRKYTVKAIRNDTQLSTTLTLVLDSVQLPLSLGRVSEGNHSAKLGILPGFESQGHRSPVVFSKLSPAKPTIIYDTYWRFAAERQAIFFRRLNTTPHSWTKDPILQQYKFTNAYRAADRVSQYLVRNVAYTGDQSPSELVFRILLFKIFNRIDTWELLMEVFGTPSAATFSAHSFGRVLSKAMESGKKIYSAAYIMPSGGTFSKTGRKHQMHLDLLERMIGDDLGARLKDTKSMEAVFSLLRSYPTIGDFLAFQYTIDLNYSTLLNYSEMDFVMPGPGARSGIRKCFSDPGGLNEVDIIKLVTDRQELECARLGLHFQSLWGRPLQLIDCQNLFCEVDKYSRVAHPEASTDEGRYRIKQRFFPKSRPIEYWFPPKWGINERIKESCHVSAV